MSSVCMVYVRESEREGRVKTKQNKKNQSRFSIDSCSVCSMRSRNEKKYSDLKLRGEEKSAAVLALS